MDISFLVEERKRQEGRLTQDKLAKKIGVSKTTLCAYESGRQKVSIDVFEKWCKELGFEIQIIKKIR